MAKTTASAPKSLAALARAAKWPPPLVDAALTELGKTAVTQIAPLVAERDLTREGVAYRTLETLLFRLVCDPKRDASPLFPVLEQIALEPRWNPDGMRQFELVRNYATRLLARAKRRTARAVLVRWLDAFPEPLDQFAASGMLHAMAESALDLGDKTLAPRFAPFFDTLLPKHDARQRENVLGPIRALVAKLAKKK